MIQIDITVKLKIKRHPNRKKHINYNISDLRNNVAELAIGDGINKEQIIDIIKIEENNNKTISNWNKQERRIFNNKLWNNTKGELGEIQNAKFALRNNKSNINNPEKLMAKSINKTR